MTEWEPDKEAAYQHWKSWTLETEEFENLNGSLIRDRSTGLVWDAVEFQEREQQEEGDGDW